MKFIPPVVVYVLLHLGAYATVLRRYSGLRQESAIFAYHAISYFFLLGWLLLAGIFWGESGWIAAVFGAALHGIYSLSFLELWSLTQGSYSLGILAHIARLGGKAAGSELAGLQSVGAVKQDLRQADLRRLKLMQPDGTLTIRGHLATLPLRAVLWLSNGRALN